jgi:ADP-L-glycero-D-manno-heptose 6-epimerase
MSKTASTILITGAAGFIGGHVAHAWSGNPNLNLILSDDFSRPDKQPNWADLHGVTCLHRDELMAVLDQDSLSIDWVIHLGARTDTTEFDYSVHERLNLNYSKAIWAYCVRRQVPLIYASSAATYGNGECGYVDDESQLDQLQPLNPYGLSKHQFDQWALEQAACPPHWYGLKFFNVYGYREAHKGRMASMIFHGYHQILDQGEVRLFRSHRTGVGDGEQKRDFVYVKDIVRVMEWLMHSPPVSGIYNLGSGQARSFNDLIRAVFSAMGLPAQIRYIDMPQDLRDTYQYYTEASMEKLRSAGYSEPFFSLEQGVSDYVQGYLMQPDQLP